LAEYSPQDLRQIYEIRFRSKQGYRDRVWQILARSFFSQWVRPDHTILDLGAGYCQFINHISAKKKYAMDLNPDVAERASGEVTVLQQDCAALWPLPTSSLDVVFTSNFFEHLPTKSDLERTLQQTFRCLRQGGNLIAMGPNIRYLPGTYWDFFDHNLALTEKALVEVLHKVGFQMVEIHPKFLPFTMTDSREYPLILLQLYLKVRPAWHLLGKQFLVFARKPVSTDPPTSQVRAHTPQIVLPIEYPSTGSTTRDTGII
jgi:SAM-dependent methyltransferase